MCKAKINALYKVDNKYSFHVLDNSIKFLFSISLGASLRLLLEESDDYKIVYNDANLIE